MTSILNFCPKCGAKLRVPSDNSEDWVDCPNCGHIEVEYYKSLEELK